MSVELSPVVLSAYLLALARCGAWVAFCPPFNRRAIPKRVRAGVAVALTMVVGPRLQSLAVPLDAGPLVVSVAGQVAVGFVLGAVVNLLFQAFTVAGSLVDVSGGFAIAQVYDPNTSVTVTVFARFYEVLAVTLLLVTDGHLLLVRGLVASFEAAPVATDSLARLPALAQADVKLLLVSALEIALPVLAAMFVTDLAIGLLSKAAPTLNVVLLSLPLKILLTLVIVGLSVSLLPDDVAGLARAALDSISRLLRG